MKRNEQNMCESIDNLYCQECNDITNHLLSGSATKATCLGCGKQKNTDLISISYNKQSYEFYAIKLKRLKEKK